MHKLKIKSKWMKLLILLWGFVYFSNAASAQELGAAALAKTTEEIVRNARNGISQDLYVSLDGDSARLKVDEEIAIKGLKLSRTQQREETRKAIDVLKGEVFPRGRLADAVVIESSKYAALMLVRIPDIKSLIRILDDPRVTGVRGNDKYRLHLSQSLPLIEQSAAVASGKTGQGYRIAVLDSGADYRQSAFAVSGTVGCRFRGQVNGYPDGPYIGDSGCRISNAFNYISNAPFWDVDVGAHHGTNVSGIVAATAPGVKLDIFNIFQPGIDGLETNFSAVRRALEWVLDNEENAAGRIVAVNLSFGGGSTSAAECTNSPYSDLFRALRSSGILPVASTGNGGNTSGISEPACAPGAVRVGSVYDQSYNTDQSWSSGCRDIAPRVDQVVCSSNSGALVTLLAPGAYITAAGYGAGGTSQAAPHVSGAIAILTQAFPNDTLSIKVSRMTSSGKTVVDQKNGISKPRLNIRAALATNLTGEVEMTSKLVAATILPLILH